MQTVMLLDVTSSGTNNYYNRIYLFHSILYDRYVSLQSAWLAQGGKRLLLNQPSKIYLLLGRDNTRYCSMALLAAQKLPLRHLYSPYQTHNDAMS